MRVLVLFERSGVVREAFRSQGHDAWSVDAAAAEDGSAYHVQMVVALDTIIDAGIQVNERLGVSSYTVWDLVIVHPVCTDLSVSGAHRFAEKQADGRQQKAIANFMACTKIRTLRLCVENPVCIMSTVWRKPDQIIQPYQFGEDASKKTCLWLKGLLKLIIDPAQFVAPRMVCSCGHVFKYSPSEWKTCPKCWSGKAKPRWANQTDSGQNRLGPSEHRAMDRARTYAGIANAMAAQWGRN